VWLAGFFVSFQLNGTPEALCLQAAVSAALDWSRDDEASMNKS
jgi:hypothetical protein